VFGFIIRDRSIHARVKAHDDYLKSQSRKFQTEFAQEKISSANFVEHPETGEMLCAQEPMRAVERITGVSSESGPSVINRTYETVPKPRIVLPNPGSPVDLTVGEIQRMTPEDRAVALARVMAVDGARERMKPDGDRTLTQALADELEYQRAMIRAAKNIARKGESERHTETQSKIDRKAGRPRTRSPGTASFTGPGNRAVIIDNNVADVRKIKRGQSLLLLNAVEK
jgi:hypothetical protein